MCEGKTNLHPDVEVITVAEERKGRKGSNQCFTTLFCPVLSCPVLLSPVLSWPVLSCPVLLSPVISCPCPALSMNVELMMQYVSVYWYR